MALSLELGLQVADLEATMPERDFQRYAAFFKWRHEQQQKK